MRDERGRFLRGLVPWNKGKTNVYSKEVLERMSLAKKGKHISLSTEFKKGHKTWNKYMKGLYIPGGEKGWFKKGRNLSKEIEIKRLKNLREKVLLQPKLEMNEDLAYILGMIKGDGCVFKHNRSYRIVLDITNKNIADSFFNSLKNIGLNPFVREQMPDNRIGKLKKYVVIATSKVFGEWYKALSLGKIERALYNKADIIAFIRGFYEVEGSFGRYKNGKYFITPISIYNTDLKLIKLTKRLLKRLGFRFNLNGPYDNTQSLGGANAKPIYRLSRADKYEVNWFMKIIDPIAKVGNFNGRSNV